MVLLQPWQPLYWSLAWMWALLCFSRTSIPRNLYFSFHALWKWCRGQDCGLRLLSSGFAIISGWSSRGFLASWSVLCLGQAGTLVWSSPFCWNWWWCWPGGARFERYQFFHRESWTIFVFFNRQASEIWCWFWGNNLVVHPLFCVDSFSKISFIIVY